MTNHKRLILIFGFLFLVIAGCKKSNLPNTMNPTSNIAVIFPTSNSMFWKAYWHLPVSGDTNTVVDQIDSIFLSLDTIGLNIITPNTPQDDTSWVTYHVLKVHSYQKRWSMPFWEDKGERNFGLYRLDTISNKVYSVNTTCYCWPGGTPIYPTNFYFNERVIYDHNLQDNDSITIKATWNTYSTIVHTDSIMFAGNYIKKQYFINTQNPSDTVSSRMQFGCVLNTSDYVNVALANSVAYRLGYFKLMFFNNSTDSIELIRDTHIYP